MPARWVKKGDAPDNIHIRLSNIRTDVAVIAYRVVDHLGGIWVWPCNSFNWMIVPLASAPGQVDLYMKPWRDAPAGTLYTVAVQYSDRKVPWSPDFMCTELCFFDPGSGAKRGNRGSFPGARWCQLRRRRMSERDGPRQQPHPPQQRANGCGCCGLSGRGPCRWGMGMALPLLRLEPCPYDLCTWPGGPIPQAVAGCSGRNVVHGDGSIQRRDGRTGYRGRFPGSAVGRDEFRGKYTWSALGTPGENLESIHSSTGSMRPYWPSLRR